MSGNWSLFCCLVSCQGRKSAFIPAQSKLSTVVQAHHYANQAQDLQSSICNLKCPLPVTSLMGSDLAHTTLNAFAETGRKKLQLAQFWILNFILQSSKTPPNLRKRTLLLLWHTLGRRMSRGRLGGVVRSTCKPALLYRSTLHPCRLIQVLAKKGLRGKKGCLRQHLYLEYVPTVIPRFQHECALT